MSVNRLLLKPGTLLMLKDDRMARVVSWNRQLNVVRCWVSESEEEIVELDRSSICLSDTGILFEKGADCENGQEFIVSVHLLNGKVGELISHHSKYGIRIYLQGDVFHREIEDFEERDGEFWEIARQVSEQLSDNMLSLVRLGQCRILMADGQIGQVSEWDLSSNEVAIVVKGSTVRRSISAVEQINEFRYRLRER